MPYSTTVMDTVQMGNFKKITKEECEAAKEALIQGIREYDESHPETEPATEPTTLQNTTAD